MNIKQERLIIKAKEYIKDIRNCLDNVMYNPNCPLADKDFKKVRKAYDLICKANDELW